MNELTDDQKHACLRDMINEDPDQLAGFLLTLDNKIEALEKKFDIHEAKIAEVWRKYENPADDIKQSILYVKGQCDGYEEAAREILADLKKLDEEHWKINDEYIESHFTEVMEEIKEKWEARKK